MSSKEPSILLVWLFRWLLFRLMLASGCVKLASDVVWRDLTALDYHYWTQPLPLWTAWWMQQAPEFTRRAATALALAIELVAPWLIFLGRRGRRVAFVSLAGLQVLIAATGNYGFFNLLTLALCLPLLGETGDSEVSPSAPALDPTDWRGRARRVSTIGLAAFILALSAPKMVRLFDANFIAPYPLDAVERQLSGFHIVNRYGLFADMTESRPEIVIEISQDGMHWAPLEFRWKPGDLQKRPRFAWFHMPRLDWQMWFEGLGFQAQDDWYASQGAPISERRYLPNRWFQRLLLSLLEAPQPGLRLLGPLPLDAPPQKVRAQVYQYRFTTLDERRETGCWWTREWAGTFVPEIGLNPNPPAKPAL